MPDVQVTPELEALLELVAKRTASSCNDALPPRRFMKSEKSAPWNVVLSLTLSAVVLVGGMLSIWINSTNRAAVADVKIQQNTDRINTVSLKVDTLENANGKVLNAADQVGSIRQDLQAFKQEYRQDFDQLKQEVRASKR